MKFPVLLANLQALMKERGWDQNELAHQVESTQPSVSRWGYVSVPRGQTLTKLATLAGVSPVDLLETPLSSARKPKPAGMPSGRKLVEMMEALLDSAGLPHLVDEYAAKLARLLPTILADSEAPLDAQAKKAGRQPGARSPAHAKAGRDTPR